MSFMMDPEYGDLTQLPDNASHTGAVVINYHLKIPNFILKTIFVGENGKVLMNHTVKPCDAAEVQRMRQYYQRVYNTADGASRSSMFFSCPLEVIIQIS